MIDKRPDGRTVSKTDARVIDILVQTFWLTVCTGIGCACWGGLTERITRGADFEYPYLAGAGIVLMVNICHYLWGWFKTDENLAGYAPAKGPLMTTHWEVGRIAMAILMIVTVCPSIYLRGLIAAIRSEGSKGKQP